MSKKAYNTRSNFPLFEQQLMQSMYFLIPISLVLFIFAIFAIYYAIKSRQFDDLDNEGQRVVLDDRQFRREQLKEEKPSPERQANQDNTKT